jgi:hypothetical protein
MDRVINSLLLKANRALSSNLASLSMVDPDHLDEANERFVEHLREGNLTRASILRVLLYELQSLDEKALIDYQLGSLSLGAVPLDRYQISETLLSGFVLEECMATWSVPVDLMGEVYCVASAYYLSNFVREFWETKLGKGIIWYVTPCGHLESLFEAVIKRREALAEEGKEA